MADLGGGGIGVGQARAQNGRTTVGSTLPVPTTTVPRVKSPREIMRDRERREALKRLQEEEQNRVRTGRNSDQNAGVGESVALGETENRRTSGRQQYTSQDVKRGAVETNATSRGYSQPTGTQHVGTNRGSDTRATDVSGTRAASQALPQQQRTGKSLRTTPVTQQSQQPQQQARASSNPVGQTRAQIDSIPNPTKPINTNNQTRNSSTSFPHAFERWETLSSHWEGLTSFWIKRLQGNSDELNGQPINQQLARQVTDLSAAGANLFHAVVELQRLRASSERKFQRWFFETRADQEKTAEKIAQLEAELSEARTGSRSVKTEVPPPPQPSLQETRIQAERLAADEIEKVKRQCAMEIKEKNRELEISREEARRGWEEIGRMEQENRDRTFSLRRGEPTVVGGVQVVPLLPDASRQTSTSRGQQGGLSSHPVGSGSQGYSYDPARSETDTDPFTESVRESQPIPQGLPVSPRQPSTSSAAIQAARTRTTSASPARPQTAGQPFPSSSGYAVEPLTSAPSGGFYQQSGAGTNLHATRTSGNEQSYILSEVSDDEYQVDENGQVLRDQQGDPIERSTNPPSDISDEYDVLERLERDQLFTRGYPNDYGQPQRFTTTTTTTSNGGTYQAPDYSGSGYNDQDWQAAVPRHHHPSRLSDVLEEDERSRTSEVSRQRGHH